MCNYLKPKIVSSIIIRIFVTPKKIIFAHLKRNFLSERKLFVSKQRLTETFSSFSFFFICGTLCAEFEYGAHSFCLSV